jgi:hypothetical protein
MGSTAYSSHWGQGTLHATDELEEAAEIPGVRELV